MQWKKAWKERSTIELKSEIKQEIMNGDLFWKCAGPKQAITLSLAECS